MIAVGILIRFFAMNWLPKRIFVVIWGLVSVRLLVPFSFPVTFDVWQLLNLPALRTGVTPGVVGGPYVPFQLPWPDVVPPSAVVEQVALSWTVVITGVWVVGSVLLALYLVATHYRFRRKMRTSLPVEHAYITAFCLKHKLRRSICIRQSDQIRSPLTYGVLRPTILLPAGMDFEDEEKLSYVLTHELIHVKRFDYVWKLVFAAVLCIYWFNPLVWLMYVLANRDIELSCDEAVLKRFGQKVRAAYGLTLLDMAERKRTLSFVGSGFSKHMVAERIRVLTKAKRKSVVGAVVALALVIGAMTAFAASPDGPVHERTDRAQSHFNIPGAPLEVDADDSGIQYSPADILNDLTVRDELVTEVREGFPSPEADNANETAYDVDVEDADPASPPEEAPDTEELNHPEPDPETEASRTTAPVSEGFPYPDPAHRTQTFTRLSASEFETLVVNANGRYGIHGLESFMERASWSAEANYGARADASEFEFYLIELRDKLWVTYEDAVWVTTNLAQVNLRGGMLTQMNIGTINHGPA